MASSAQHTFSASAENLLEIIIKNVSNVRNFSTKNKDAIGDSVDELRRIITEADGRINELENHVCTKVPTYAEVMSLSPPLNKIKTTHVVTIHPMDGLFCSNMDLSDHVQILYIGVFEGEEFDEKSLSCRELMVLEIFEFKVNEFP
jgi:hypothetical protein